MNLDFKNLQVSILASDLKKSKALSLALREFNIYASVFVSLEELLLSFTKNKYDLNIIDVTSISEGLLSLCNNSSFKVDNMNFSMVYDESSSHAMDTLDSVYFSQSNGLINLDVSLKPQLLGLLSKLSKIKMNDNSLAIAKREVRTLSIKNLNLERESISFHDTIRCYESFTNFLDGFKGNEDFLSKILNSLETWKDCYTFSLLSYNEKTGRLKSLNLSSSKYKDLPGMEFSKRSLFSENFFDMLTNAYSDKFNSTSKAISISLDNQLILIGEFSSELKEDKAWSYFSNSLSLIGNDVFDVPVPRSESDFFSFLNQVDDEYFNKAKSDLKYLAINLRPLAEFITSKYTSRFYWEEFMNAFEASIKSSPNMDIKVTRCATNSVFVGVDGLRLKECYDLLKVKIKDFHYWEFFADKSIIFSSNSYPTLNLAATSSSGIIRGLNNDSRINLSNRLMEK